MCASARAGLGEVVVTRLDDEANIAPWLRAANRYGAKVKWAEVDIENGELPAWQWEGLLTRSTRIVAIASASATFGTPSRTCGRRAKLVQDLGGLVIVDRSAAGLPAAGHRPEERGHGVAVNAVAWGGPPHRRAGLPGPVAHRFVQLGGA